MNLISGNMEQIAKLIVRPSRPNYKNNDLGAKNIIIEGEPVTRIDFDVKNRRGNTLKCSYYSKDKGEKTENFLIYLHCNSGCRIEGKNLAYKGLTYLKLAIENDFNYVIFDFAGCGLSGGDYVSLGFYQVQDLDAVINHIKTQINQEARFSLWGRSMGAVTGNLCCSLALRYLALYRQPVKIAVIDSPFESLKKLFLQIGKKHTNFPQILLNVAYKYIKPIILQKVEFDIDEMDLSELVKNIATPGIFIASKQDDLIPFSQIENLFNRYKGEKEMFFIEESHNEARNIGVIRKVFKTFKKQLLLLEQSQLKKQKASFYTNINLKDLSKKKLELTIKSQSQRLLKYHEPQEKARNQNIQIEINLLQKKQASCLFGTNKYKRQKKTSQVILLNNTNEQIIETKRKPLLPKHFVSEDNVVVEETKGRPKFLGEAKMIEIKKKPKENDGRSKQRKTFQHISSKRPPFVELKGMKENRNSFELRYRS